MRPQSHSRRLPTCGPLLGFEEGLPARKCWSARLGRPPLERALGRSTRLTPGARHGSSRSLRVGLQSLWSRLLQCPVLGRGRLATACQSSSSPIILLGSPGVCRKVNVGRTGELEQSKPEEQRTRMHLYDWILNTI
jgi:hypothetical protein